MNVRKHNRRIDSHRFTECALRHIRLHCLSPATVLQTVVQWETVKADASTVPATGQGSSSAARAARSRSGWTPSTPFQYRAPIPLSCTAASTGGQPARCAPLVPLFAAPAGPPARRPAPRLPARLQRVGAGLRPRCTTSPWAGLFPIRAGNGLRLPRARWAVWARRNLAGCG